MLRILAAASAAGAAEGQWTHDDDWLAGVGAIDSRKEAGGTQIISTQWSTQDLIQLKNMTAEYNDAANDRSILTISLAESLQPNIQ